jgi:peroxiredoxin family protein
LRRGLAFGHADWYGLCLAGDRRSKWTKRDSRDARDGAKPQIPAATAAAMNMDATLFFTFYGLGLLKKELDLEISPLGNPAMKMPVAGIHLGMPNLVAALPGVTAGATAMMKNMIERKGVATIQELRDISLESGVKLVACQMTMDLFEFKKEDMIEGVSFGGAATYLEEAVKADVNLFI